MSGGGQPYAVSQQMKPVSAPMVKPLPPQHEPMGSVSRGQTDGVLRLRGLPFHCSAAEVWPLYADYEVDETQVYLRLHTVGARIGQQNGDAFIRFASPQLAQAAMMKANRLMLSGRYIELFPSSEQELAAQAAIGGIIGYEQNNPLHRGGGNGYAPAEETFGKSLDVNPQEDRPGSGWVRLRGLPYTATQLDVLQVFLDCEVNITEHDITIKYGTDGRPTGEAFVQVASPQLADAAVRTVDRHLMGGRYIEAFEC